MKILKHIGIAIIFGIFIMACGNTEESNTTDETEVTEKSSTEAAKAKSDDANDKSKDCEEYLDNFEKWAEDYIKVLDKIKSNPTDQTVATEYAKLAPEVSNWAMKWGELMHCAQDEAFVKRYEEITQRITDAAEKK